MRWLSRIRLKPPVLVRAPAAENRRHSAQRSAAVATLAGVVAFAVLQAALSGASVVTRLIADPVYADKERRLKRLEEAAPANASCVILLGTSRTGYGFAAGRTQQTANQAGTPAVVFNFGVPGAGPVMHLLYLRRLLADGHRPDLLILEVLPPLLADPPAGPLERRAISGDLLTQDEIVVASTYGLPAHLLHRQWIGATVNPIHAHRFKLLGRASPSFLPWQLRYDSGRTHDPNGWNASIVTDVTPEQRASGIATTVAEYRDVFKYNLPAGPAVTALRDTLTLCRAEHIPVVLVVFPEATSFRALYPSRVEAKLSRFFAGLCEEFGCSLTDARTWLPDDAFLDSHHMLRIHAEVFTDRFTSEAILPFLQANTRRKGQ